MAAKEGIFLSLQLLDEDKNLITENLYWMPDHSGNYSGLQTMKQNDPLVSAKYVAPGKVEVTVDNKQNTLAFFNRLSLVDAGTKAPLLPAFYSDNYITVLPGQQKKVIIEYNKPADKNNLLVDISGWHTPQKYIAIGNK